MSEPEEPPKPIASTCEITGDGFLVIRCPLRVVNGELMAYGMLEKARQFVVSYVEEAQERIRQANSPIIKPLGPNGGH